MLSKNENGYFVLSFSENKKNIKFKLVQTAPELISYDEHILPVENIDGKIIAVTCMKDNKTLVLSLINDEAKKAIIDSYTEMKETEENIWIESIAQFISRLIKIAATKKASVSYTLSSNMTADINVKYAESNFNFLHYTINKFDIFSDKQNITFIFEKDKNYNDIIEKSFK